MVLQFAARPYVRGRMDSLEGLCAVSIFFYGFASILFTDVGASRNEAPVCGYSCPVASMAWRDIVVCMSIMGFNTIHARTHACARPHTGSLTSCGVDLCIVNVHLTFYCCVRAHLYSCLYFWLL